MKALLALEDGMSFPCRSFTGPGEASGEIVFNTGMTGYQEILTDPSYRGQMVTLTYPLIGNYGINVEDVESDRVQVSALLVREYQPFPSNHRSCGDLAGYLKRASVLGIQLLGLALGGSTFKLKFGHRGCNQPVKNLLTGRVEITSQNHGFAVDPDSIKDKNVRITHINLNDNTLEGFRHLNLPVFAVQYHPEASPGPHDAAYLFSEFTQMMKN